MADFELGRLDASAWRLTMAAPMRTVFEPSQSPRASTDGRLATRFVPALLLGLVVGFGLLVRVLGVRLGLPFFHHWDEVWVISSARQMLEQGSDLPTSYQYGAPMSRLIALVVEAGEATGVFPLGSRDEVFLRWVGRAIGVTISASGIVAMYVAGRSAGASPKESQRLGLYAAIAYAFAYELVTHARYAVTDACLVAFAAWSLAFCGQLIRSRHPGWAALAVLSAGLAFSFKPTAGPTILLPLTALALVRMRRAPTAFGAMAERASLMAAVPAFFACFLFLNPHYVDRWQEALHDLTVRVAQTKDGGFPEFLLRDRGLDHLASALVGLGGHTLSRHSWLSWPLSALALFGLTVALWKRRLVVFVGLAHAVAVVLLIALPNRAFLLRNYLVAVPALSLGLAFGLDWLTEAIRRSHLPLVAGAALATPAFVLLPPITATLADSFRNEQLSKDARERAIDWLDAQAQERTVTVSPTESVFGKGALGGNRLVAERLARPRLRFRKAIRECPAEGSGSPDYILTASFRGDPKSWSPYVERWHFQDCPGYRAVARFEANPYEHTWWVTETWDGRVSAVVLERADLVARPSW